jgi:hypothetical protein
LQSQRLPFIVSGHECATFAHLWTPDRFLRSNSGAGTSNPVAISRSVFIGQTYPSGNTYLRSFADSQDIVTWPKSILLVTVPGKASTSIQSFEAELVSSEVRPSYIPGIEGMDIQHAPCGAEFREKHDSTIVYLSEDFFNASFDYCDPNKGVAMYRATPVPFSVRVLAFPTEIRIVEPRSLTGTRTATKEELAEVPGRRRNLPRDAQRLAPSWTPLPACFRQTLTTDFPCGCPRTKSPGCTGHLSTIYLLDVLRGQEVLRTFPVSQSHGPTLIV